MASLNQIVSEIAHAIHQPNNFTARRTIRSAVIHTFNEQIRQTYQRHANVDKILMQRYRISLINVPDGDIFQTLVSTKYKVKRSKNRVPRPVRLDNNLPLLVFVLLDMIIWLFHLLRKQMLNFIKLFQECVPV